MKESNLYSVSVGLDSQLWKGQTDLEGGLCEVVLMKASYSGPEELSQGRLHTDHSDELFPQALMLRAYTEIAGEQDLLLSWEKWAIGQESAEEQGLALTNSYLQI